MSGIWGGVGFWPSLANKMPSLFDMALLATVAWTHAGVDALDDAIAGLAIFVVVAHQILLDDIFVPPVDGGSEGGGGARRPTWAVLVSVVADGIAPIAISGLSFALDQAGPAAVQLVLAVASAATLHMRCRGWCPTGR